MPDVEQENPRSLSIGWTERTGPENLAVSGDCTDFATHALGTLLPMAEVCGILRGLVNALLACNHEAGLETTHRRPWREWARVVFSTANG